MSYLLIFQVQTPETDIYAAMNTIEAAAMYDVYARRRAHVKDILFLYKKQLRALILPLYIVKSYVMHRYFSSELRHVRSVRGCCYA